MTDNNLPEGRAPGDVLADLLIQRGWSQGELAEILGRSDSDISAIVLGRRSVSFEIARELAIVFGTTAEYWLDLEMRHRESRREGVDSDIARRARLYHFAPIREMIKRNWLPPSHDLDILEERVRQFFEVTTLNEPVNLPHAARKGTQGISPAQWAWIFRVKRLAPAAPCTGTFSGTSFRGALSELRRLLPSAEEARQVPRILADAGIRFLVLEHLPQTRIDGVTLWLNTKSPVVALSLRYDRIDCFWYTLAHELGHVAHRDGMTQIMLDTAIVGEDAEAPDEDADKEADSFATDFLVKHSELEDFIARVRPLYSRQRVLGFAKTIGVHPGVVVGQLQHRGEVKWSSFRPMLEKVRHVVTQSALTDGWGHEAPSIT